MAVAYASGLLLLALLPFSLPSRLALALCGGLIFSGLLIGRQALRRVPTFGRSVTIAWLVLLPLVLLLLRGLGPVLPIVRTNQWGGLLLTMVLAIFGIVLSFPLGVLLAIGRRSRVAYDQRVLHALYRADPRRAPDHCAVYGSEHPAAVCARRREY